MATVTTAQVHEDARNDLPNDMARFLDYLYDFFYMYGERYQKWNHVMSCHLGRWQERRIQPEQRSFTTNQKRYVIQMGKKENQCCINTEENITRKSFFLLSCWAKMSHICLYFCCCCCGYFYQIARWHQTKRSKLEELLHVFTRFGATQFEYDSRNPRRTCWKFPRTVPFIRYTIAKKSIVEIHLNLILPSIYNVLIWIDYVSWEYSKQL